MILQIKMQVLDFYSVWRMGQARYDDDEIYQRSFQKNLPIK